MRTNEGCRRASASCRMEERLANFSSGSLGISPGMRGIPVILRSHFWRENPYRIVSAGMGIATQLAMRLQTSDFYGPSPQTPNTQAPHDRPPPPPPNIRLVDKWKMGKYGTSENFQHGRKHSPPPRFE